MRDLRRTLAAANTPSPSVAVRLRRAGFVALCAGAAIVLLTATVLDRPREPPRAELARRLRTADAPERFAFRFRAGGSQVAACFLPNRELFGVVNKAAGALEVRNQSASGPVVAVVTGRRALLHRSLFAPGVVGSAWLEVPRPVPEPAAAALRRALGTDLAAYVIANAVPADGKATAVAALELARAVRRVPTPASASVAGDRFAIELDTKRFNERTSPATETSMGSSPETLRMDVWLGARNFVTRIEVRARPPGGTAGDVISWAVEYRKTGRVAADRRPRDVSALGGRDPSSLVGARIEDCNLPL